MNPINFFVPGTAATAGSKTVSLVWICKKCKKKSSGLNAGKCPVCGSYDVFDVKAYRHASKFTKPWMDLVKFFAIKETGRMVPVSHACDLRIDFYFSRPKGDFGTGRNEGKLKLSAPMFMTKKPDVSKLVRAVEDALTGIVWKDDSQVVSIQARKHYVCNGHPPGAEISIQSSVRREHDED